MKVRIRKNSWFYNFADWFDVTEKKNLCSFFWTLLGRMCLAVIFFTASILAILYGGAFLFNPLITFLTQAYVGYPLSQTFLAYVFGGSLSDSLSIGTLVWYDFFFSYVAWTIFLLFAYHIWLKDVLVDWIDNYNKNTATQEKVQKKTLLLPVVIIKMFEFIFDLFEMFTAFLKAKKEKYCPLIEYVDNDGE